MRRLPREPMQVAPFRTVKSASAVKQDTFRLAPGTTLACSPITCAMDKTEKARRSARCSRSEQAVAVIYGVHTFRCQTGPRAKSCHAVSLSASWRHGLGESRRRGTTRVSWTKPWRLPHGISRRCTGRVGGSNRGCHGVHMFPRRAARNGGVALAGTNDVHGHNPGGVARVRAVLRTGGWRSGTATPPSPRANLGFARQETRHSETTDGE